MPRPDASYFDQIPQTLETPTVTGVWGFLIKQDSRDYFQQRERHERAAAKKATCPQARRVHQELAQGYAALARQEAVNADLVDVRSSFGAGYPVVLHSRS